MHIHRETERPDPRARLRIFESLGRASGPCSCLAISRDTGLSSLVVVPMLNTLVEEGVLARSSAGPRSQWAYRLTPRGHRELRRRRPPGPQHRPDPRAPEVRPRAS